MLTGHRDTDFYLTNYLEDQDLINLCEAIPGIYKDENFWKQKFITNYGQYNKNPKSWKKFYLSVVYYLDKAKNNVDRAMNLAAKGGHRDLVDFFISLGADYWNWGMYGAARGGHRDLVERFISKGADDWNWGMEGAAKGGHQNLVDFFISKGANNWNWGMEYATLGGHRDLVDFFISKGANNWNSGMYYATLGGHQDLIEFFQQKLQK